MATYAPLGGEAARLYQNVGTVQLPKELRLKASSAKTFQVAEGWVWNGAKDLRQHVQNQLMQSRFAYFVYQEMYRRDTWIRAVVDYIVRRVTRDDNRLVDKSDPLNPDIRELEEFLENCYPDGSWHDIYETIARDMLVYAQAYVEVERDFKGNPVHLWPMDSRITFPITDLHGTIIGHAQVYNGTVTWYTTDEVLYFPLRNNSSNPNGVATMETLYASVAMELQANRYNMALFENNLNVGAVFSMPNASPESIEEHRRYLLDQYAGPQNAHLPLLLSGEAKMLRDGATALKDLNFEALISLARQRVCSVFGVPESLIGVSDSVNRSEGQVHERDTYVNTIRPLRRKINRRFTHQFICRVWGSRHICLTEPLNSMLPTMQEIEAVAKAAEVGLMYNDILEMLGLPRVANGDYFVMKIPGAGGYIRLDQTAMPGLGDPHFDFIAYQLNHEQQMAQASEAAMQGIQMPSPATQYVPPRPQDQIQTEPIASRIIDVSRSFALLIEEHGWVERRMPLRPGIRGSSTVYITAGGKPRYGTPPKGKQAKTEAPDGSPANNDLTNPKDPNPPKGMSPEERLMMASARNNVDNLFQEALEKNWTNEQFINALEENGWQQPPDTMEQFPDVRAARAEARRLAEINPDRAYVLLGKEGHYFLMENELSKFGESIEAPKEGTAQKKSTTNSAKTVRREAVQRGFDADTWAESISRVLETR